VNNVNPEYQARTEEMIQVKLRVESDTDWPDGMMMKACTLCEEEDGLTQLSVINWMQANLVWRHYASGVSARVRQRICNILMREFSTDEARRQSFLSRAYLHDEVLLDRLCDSPESVEIDEVNRCELLGWIGGGRALFQLRKRLSDGDGEVRIEAAASLAMNGDADGVQILCDAGCHEWLNGPCIRIAAALARVKHDMGIAFMLKSLGTILVEPILGGIPNSVAVLCKHVNRFEDSIVTYRSSWLRDYVQQLVHRSTLARSTHWPYIGGVDDDLWLSPGPADVSI